MNLEGANSGGLGDGSPPAGSRGDREPTGAVEGLFRCHLWHLGGHGPLVPPLNPPVNSHDDFTSNTSTCLFKQLSRPDSIRL